MGNQSAKPAGAGHGQREAEVLGKEYNVFMQPINPQNNMPLAPNQIPAEGQSQPLSTGRVVSSIPKGGTEGKTWAYPSEQMFYNALRRKNKADNMTEDDVSMIVAIHNNMNEKTWNRVREWEAMHQAACPDGPRLSRFMGRPDDLTPLAYAKSWLPGAGELPFDRHDWFVDRCGTEVRYVIDYYHSDERAKLDQAPRDQQDKDAIKSIEFNARPALDSVQAGIDRVKFPVLEFLGRQPAVPDIVLPEPKPKKPELPAEPVPDYTKQSLDDMRAHSRNIHNKCQNVHKALRECGEDETQCRKLSVSMFHCMASVVCPGRATAYEEDVTSEKKFDDILECLGKFESHAAKVFAKKPE